MADHMVYDSVLALTRRYVQDSFLYMQPDVVIGDEDRLLEKGIIDSMGVLELIGFLQGKFGIAVRDEDISEHNLGTLADIARYVASRRANGAAA